MAKKGLPIKKAEGKTTPVPVKIVASAPEPYKTDEARERKWKAEDALRDIERAEGHKRDKNLMKDVKQLAKEKVNSLKKIC